VESGARDMTNIRSFKELRVWQLGMDVAMAVFEVPKNFPAIERFSLVDQIRRSSRSVPSNIAEAWRKRRYPAGFVSQRNDAEGEAAETQTHLEIARRCAYLDDSTAQRLDDQYEEVLAMLVAMASHPEMWTIREAHRRNPAPGRSGTVVPTGGEHDHG
jgi:four helix bundle protein